MTGRWPVDSEVAVTITGRVIHSNEHGLVMEYVGGCGLLTRTAIELRSPAVCVSVADGPTAEESAVRELAAQMVAEAGRHLPPSDVVLR